MSKKNEQTIRTAIAMKLKQYKDCHGLTQRQMADLLNETRSNYAKFEARKQTPRVQTLVAISDLLHITVNELTCSVYSLS